VGILFFLIIFSVGISFGLILTAIGKKVVESENKKHIIIGQVLMILGKILICSPVLFIIIIMMIETYKIKL
jgi:hypothetical protein